MAFASSSKASAVGQIENSAINVGHVTDTHKHEQDSTSDEHRAVSPADSAMEITNERFGKRQHDRGHEGESARTMKQEDQTDLGPGVDEMGDLVKIGRLREHDDMMR